MPINTSSSVLVFKYYGGGDGRLGPCNLAENYQSQCAMLARWASFGLGNPGGCGPTVVSASSAQWRSQAWVLYACGLILISLGCGK